MQSEKFADVLAFEFESFESRLFDHLSNPPYLLRYYIRNPGKNQAGSFSSYFIYFVVNFIYNT